MQEDAPAHLATIMRLLLQRSTLTMRGRMLTVMLELQCLLRGNASLLLAAQDQGSNQEGQQAPEDMQDFDQLTRQGSLTAEHAHKVQQQTPMRPTGTCASIAQRSAPEGAPEMVRAHPCHWPCCEDSLT